jgi:hypothetical protein
MGEEVEGDSMDFPSMLRSMDDLAFAAVPDILRIRC